LTNLLKQVGSVHKLQMLEMQF